MSSEGKCHLFDCADRAPWVNSLRDEDPFLCIKDNEGKCIFSGWEALGSF